MDKMLRFIIPFLLLFTNLGSLPAAGQPTGTTDSIIYVDRDATGANNGSSWGDAYTDLQLAMGAAASGDHVWVAEGTYYPTTSATGIIYYVDVQATGVNDGSSWANAYTDLQPAIDAATSGDQVWVAAGTYLPTIEHCGTGSPRYRSFQLKNAVGVYGGFDPSTGDVGWADRDWQANETILSGDIGTPGDNSDNSYHVFCQSEEHSLNSTAILDGFMIQAGNANGSVPWYDDSGGGMFIDFYNLPTLVNLIISNNSATGSGGGFYGHAYLMNVAFSENTAGSGGGMYNRWSPALINVTFSHNSAIDGGGLNNFNNTSSKLTNVIFFENTATGYGGGMFSDSSSPLLTNVTFYANSAGSGGALYSGGMYALPILINSILWGDTPDEIVHNSLNVTTVTYSDVQGGFSGEGNIDAIPLFVDAASGNLHLQSNSPAIDAADNTVEGLFGITTDLDGSPRFSDVPWVVDTGKGTPPIVDMGAYEYQLVNLAQGTGMNNSMSKEITFSAILPVLDTAAQPGLPQAAAGSAPQASDDCGTGHGRYKSFRLKNGVALYGGFDPTHGDVGWEDRDWEANPTILSGDLGIPGDASDNSYHVFCHPETLQLDRTAVLDGFQITAGNANGVAVNDSGGGMLNQFNSPTLVNVKFSENLAAANGGGLSSSSSPILDHVSFYNNSATIFGGGMYNAPSWDLGPTSPKLVDVVFSGNAAEAGGGLFNDYSTSPTLINVIFSDNTANQGGGIFERVSFSTLTNIIFFNNSAANEGGAIYNSNSSLNLANLTIYANSAGSGGGIFNSMVYDLATIMNSILWGNSPDEIANSDSWPIVAYSDIQGGYAGTGNIAADPLFVDANAGNLHLQQYSPAIDAGDNAAPALAGITIDMDGHPRFIDDPLVADHGNGVAPIVDMGAYEYGVIRYVDLDATGANNGSSWANAYTDLQPAMDAAALGDQVWVAAGTYLPTVEHCGSDVRNKSFQLKNGVAVYGGFDPSAGDVDWDERDWESNPTLLSGDLGTLGVSSDNSYHVFCHPQGLNLDDTAVLDGFIIKDGVADGPDSHDSGGGMYNGDNNSPTLAHITFSDNTASASGGGMANDSSSPDLVSITFTNNSANQGGGMANNSSSPTLTNITFSENSASAGGGGISNASSSPSLMDVTFSSNTASQGGGMFNEASSPALVNVTFTGNTASQGGGMANSNSSPSLNNVTFSANTAINFGGGMFNYDSTPTLSGITFSDNLAGDGGGLANSGSSPALNNVTFKNNTAQAGDFHGGNGGGMLNMGSSSPILTNVTFSGNTAYNGGGMVNSWASSPILTNVTFSNNTASNQGGGLYNNDSSTPTLVNATFSTNTASSGGGIYNTYDSISTLTNSILWGDSPDEIMNTINSHTTVTYSDIWLADGSVYTGTGNIDADPLLGPLANNGGFVLTHALGPASPAIDAANPNPVACPSTDARGVTRPRDGNGDRTAICDMGAYEYQFIIVTYLPIASK